jgi:hypothetical protein
MMNRARLIMSPSDPDPIQQELRASTFDVITRRKRITLFKLGKVWVFKHFFDNKETFKALAESYKEDKFRFEFKTFGERDNALKILDRAGFDYELVEDLRPFVVKLSRYSKYAPLPKNSISHMETADWRIFLMKDQAAVEEAMRMGADMYRGDYSSLVFR